MADTILPHLNITQQTIGGNANTWGNILNASLGNIDAARGNVTDIVTTGGTVVLTDEQEIVAAVEVSGTLVSNSEIEFSGRGGVWVVENLTSGAFTVTCLVNGQTGVEIPQGTAQIVYCDGTDIRLGNTTPDAVAEVTVASAATTNILAAGSEFIAISGTATITSFGTGANAKRFCRATGAFTITHNAASLICPGGSNIVAAAGDTFLVISDASSNARILFYQRAAAPPAHVPIGQVTDFAGPNAPAFWLLCFGQEVSRTTYAALFAVLGITYGAGNGTTTFNLPDLRGRVVAGQDDMGGTSANRLTNQSGGVNGDTLGATGGAETHTLTDAQMPSHNHAASVTDPGHTHPFQRYDQAWGKEGGETFPDVVSHEHGLSTFSTSSAATGISVSIGNAGSGSAHNNVQPTAILNKIIFAGV